MTKEIQLGKIYKYKEQYGLNGMEHVVPLQYIEKEKTKYQYIKFSVVENNRISKLSVGNFIMFYELVEGGYD